MWSDITEWGGIKRHNRNRNRVDEEDMNGETCWGNTEPVVAHQTHVFPRENVQRKSLLPAPPPFPSNVGNGAPNGRYVVGSG